MDTRRDMAMAYIAMYIAVYTHNTEKYNNYFGVREVPNPFSMLDAT